MPGSVTCNMTLNTWTCFVNIRAKGVKKRKGQTNGCSPRTFVASVSRVQFLVLAPRSLVWTGPRGTPKTSQMNFPLHCDQVKFVPVYDPHRSVHSGEEHKTFSGESPKMFHPQRNPHYGYHEPDQPLDSSKDASEIRGASPKVHV